MKPLTLRRREMLEALAKSEHPYPAASWYPPLKWCLEQGYATEIEGTYGARYAITDAGRALRAQGEG